MELTTRLDRNRYHWMASDVENLDPAALMVEVTTPPLPETDQATPTALVVVLDRSGSMGGERLAHAQRALCDVVDQLSSNDVFGLVTFDDQVEVTVHAGPVRDRAAIKHAIRSIHPRGSTDLASGLIRGLKEARRLELESGVRVLLISDGHANHGVTDPAVIGARVTEFLAQRITTSCLGVGLGYDEALLDVIAREGTGSIHFAAEADTAAAAIAAECGELLGQRFLQCRLTFSPGNGVGQVDLLNDLPHHVTKTDDVVVELGNLGAEESRGLVLLLGAKTAPKPGRRKVGTVRVSYTLADDLSDGSESVTVWAKIAAPEEKPGKIDRDVRAEVLFQQIQRLKLRVSQALMHGDVDAAKRRLRRIERHISRAWDTIPADRRPEFAAEVAQAQAHREALDEDEIGSSAMVSKMTRADGAQAARKRDPRRRG